MFQTFKRIVRPYFIYLAAILYFTGLISFEAAQQYYYITNFDLAGKDEVTFFGLLRLHLIRWGIWGLLVIPLSWYSFRNPIRQLSPKAAFSHGVGIILTLTATIVTISLVVLWRDQLSVAYFPEFLSFFTYQKAALFVNAYLGLIILINLYQKVELLDAKLVELSDLKTEYKTIYDELSNGSKNDQTPLIQIKVGNKVKNILLSDIIWIQSDDYCVKIHTEERSYHLRKSMKLLEQELEPRGFIRLHRNAIVNKEEVDTLVYSPEPHVNLKNGQTLPIAASRVAKVKALFKGYLGLPA